MKKQTKCKFCGSLHSAHVCPNCGAPAEHPAHSSVGSGKRRGFTITLGVSAGGILVLVLLFATGVLPVRGGSSALVQGSSVGTASTSAILEAASTPVESASIPTQNGSSSSAFPLSAADVVSRFQQEGLPLGNIIVYDETTDPNGNLGRPNQYTEKINFADTRLDQYDENDPLGGTVEIFATRKDAELRYNYVQSVYESFPLLAHYCYLQENILLRITFDLTPTQAEEYQVAFEALCAERAQP